MCIYCAIERVRLFLYSLTGGRPMKFKKYSFFDSIINKHVKVYEDHNGEEYLATSKWGFDRKARI